MTDQSAERAIDLSVEVPGTVEQVWDAIASGPGISSWFVPTDLEQRAGGTITLDFGAMGKDESKVLEWDPPHRFVGEGKSAQGTPMAVEWLVEARDHGSCVVRLVQTGFGPGEEWDGDFNGLTEGWKLFLENLRLHLTHFAGEEARAVLPMAMVPGNSGTVWPKLCAALGIPADLQVGDRVEPTSSDAPPVRGVIHHAQQRPGVSDYLLVLDGELRGTSLLAAEGSGEQTMVSVWTYLYGGDAPAVDRQITEFLATHFPPASKPE